MKTIVFFTFLMQLSLNVLAGEVLRVSPENVTHFSYNDGYDCASFSITVQGRKLEGGPYCGGQGFVKDQINLFIKSPSVSECVKEKFCHGRRCRYVYGLRTTVREMMFMVGPNNEVEDFKLRSIPGPCLL